MMGQGGGQRAPDRLVVKPDMFDGLDAGVQALFIAPGDLVHQWPMQCVRTW